MKNIVILKLAIGLTMLLSCANNAPTSPTQNEKVDSLKDITGEHVKKTDHQGKPQFLYEMVLTPSIKSAELGKQDSLYFNKLIKQFNYKESVLIYSLTNLKVNCNGKTYDNIVYQNTKEKSQLLINLQLINKDNYYLVVNTQTNIIGRPGTGGISYHPASSNKHILCLNGLGNSNGVSIDDDIKGGFPSPVFKPGLISWYYN